jgi:lysophospholipase L1-like esterase
VVNTFNERFETASAVNYYENNASRDPVINQAVSGATMADFETQVQNVIAASASTPTGKAEMVTVLLGSNDVCAADIASMTDPAVFEAEYRAGLDALAGNESTKKAQIHVSGIPAIYWLWESKRDVLWCKFIAWPFVPCENLLDNPADDCASTASREDPDNVYPGDGSNCQRRKEFHRLIRDTYNPILRDVLAEYRNNGELPNARYTDIMSTRFQSSDINGGDCFHPSAAGHALLADTEWCKTHWGNDDPACSN